MFELTTFLLLGVLATVIGNWVILLSSKGRYGVVAFGRAARLAYRLKSEGISAIQFHRNQYRERLYPFLSRAKSSVKIISVSFKLPNDEQNILSLFLNRLRENDNFHVIISLLNPDSACVKMCAQSLNCADADLSAEIRIMLDKLDQLRKSMVDRQKRRFTILVHDCFPMGSAILLDADSNSGIIQVETKLYKSSRIESFGFQVEGPSEFYTRNYRGWTLVLDESTEYSQ